MPVTGRDKRLLLGLVPVVLLQSCGVAIAAVLVLVGLPAACGLTLVELLEESPFVANTIVVWALVNLSVTVVVGAIVRWRVRRGFARSVTFWLVAVSAGVAAAGLAFATAVLMHGLLEPLAAYMVRAEPPDACGDPDQFLFLFFGGPFLLAVALMLYIVGEVLGVVRIGPRGSESRRA